VTHAHNTHTQHTHTKHIHTHTQVVAGQGEGEECLEAVSSAQGLGVGSGVDSEVGLGVEQRKWTRRVGVKLQWS